MELFSFSHTHYSDANGIIYKHTEIEQKEKQLLTS